MSSRKIRRVAAHRALKQARKAAAQQAGLPTIESAAVMPETPTHPDQDETLATALAEPPLSENTAAAEMEIPEPGLPFPALSSISPARLAANRANARHSTGPSAASLHITSQNRTTHGLARHTNGTFKVMGNEEANTFEAFKQSLVDEHQPVTPTETILVQAMAESHWLSQRAQRLQDTCLHPKSGEITDEKKFSVYMRYQTTHARAFHKSLNGLLKLRSEKRKVELGFEAQRVKNEKHEMKKQSHYWDVLKKDGAACHQISLNTLQNMRARNEMPGFDAEFEAELLKNGLKQDASGIAAVRAA